MENGAANANLWVLVVEDDEVTRQAISTGLSRAGFKIETADCAETALELCSTLQFSCVVTDLSMPGLGGHALIRECQRRGRKTPILVVSGSGREAASECLEAGASGFVAKPYSPKELRATVLRLCQSAKAGTPNVGNPPVRPLAPSISARSIESVVAQIRRGEFAIPATSSVALKVRQLALSSDGSAREMKELVERDGALAGQIIRMANSGYYPGDGKLNSLQSAIARVGLREISTLVNTLIAKEFYRVGNASLQARVSERWRSSWVRAITTRFLVAALPPGPIDGETAYLAALFCDVGAAFLYKALSDHAPACDNEEIEAVVVAHHAAVGAAIARSWQLPEECVTACRDHHDEDAARIASHHTLQMIRGGDALARASGMVSDFPNAVSARALECLSMSADVQDRIADDVARYVAAHQAEGNTAGDDEDDDDDVTVRDRPPRVAGKRPGS